jgi:hypothetical protein
MPRSISDLFRTFEDRFRVGKAGGGAKSFELFNGFLGRLLWTPTANRDIIIPDAAGTVVLQNGGRIDGLAPAITNGQPVTFEQIPSLRAERPGLIITAAATQFTPTTVAQVANTLRAFPWEVKRSATINSIRSEVTTLLAATSYRLGIYSDTNSYPNALLTGSDAQVYDASIAGIKTGTPTANFPIVAGTLIWFVINANGAFSGRALPVSSVPNVLGSQGNLGSTSCFTGWSIAQAFGALPATFPAGAALLANVAPIIVGLQTV